jgi:D-glycero-D-manno-heptose 1,7-bisphosphate phosphatase
LIPQIDRSWSVFVDRDGVVNRRIVGDYVRSVDQLDVLPEALAGLRLLAEHAGPIVVVSNQAGVGKGLMTSAQLDEVNGALLVAVDGAGGRIDGIFTCPHTVEDDCDCRKPRTGLADQAVAQVPGIDLVRAVMIGDSASDVEFAERLGVPIVQVVAVGEATERGAVAAVSDLQMAAELITQVVRTETAPSRPDRTPRDRS